MKISKTLRAWFIVHYGPNFGAKYLGEQPYQWGCLRCTRRGSTGERFGEAPTLEEARAAAERHARSHRFMRAAGPRAEQ